MELSENHQDFTKHQLIQGESLEKERRKLAVEYLRGHNPMALQQGDTNDTDTNPERHLTLDWNLCSL
eukprot:IDg23273t1